MKVQSDDMHGCLKYHYPTGAPKTPRQRKSITQVFCKWNIGWRQKKFFQQIKSKISPPFLDVMYFIYN